MNPLVSVVTVTYNLVKSGRSEAFRRAVDSVHNQTYENIEHIIIDGASNDGTLDLFRDYELAGKVNVYSEPDTGIYNAMNKGLARAKGKYIIYLNSDDFWHNPKGIEQSVYILELAQADFSVAPFTLQKENGEVPGSSIPSLASFFAIMPCCHNTMLARTELLRKLDGFDESYKISADYNLTTRLLLQGAHPVYTPCNFVTFCEGGISNAPEMRTRHQEERLRVFHHNYDPIIGSERASRLLYGEADADLIHALSYIVHPSVSVHLTEIVKSYNMARYLIVSGGAVQHDFLTRTTKITGLFNIPLVEICSTPHSSRYKILGCLPLVSVHIQPTDFASHTRTLYLCGIPFLKYKYSEQSSRALLFGHITIYKKRTR